MPRTFRWVGLLLCGALAPACSPDRPDSVPPLAPSLTAAVDPTITGAVFGSDGTNICSSLSDPFAIVLVRPIIVDGPIQPNQFLFCPDNSFSFTLPSGDHFVRATLPDDPAIGVLPTRTLEPLVVGDVDITHNIFIQPGLQLPGRASLDDAALPDVGMNLTYDIDARFGAAVGASGPEGWWTEFFRPAMILQPNLSYRPQICGALGVVALELPPPVFSLPADTVNCTLVTAPSTRFSHQHTRLVVTPMPGDIGGQAATLPAGYGRGWGVQFPVAPGSSPLHVPESATHLFAGGLIIGIAPDRILSGADLSNQLECETCQDLGQDGVVHFTPDTKHGRTVRWRYSDAASPEGVGLQITQRSFDGQAPHDYVLFEYSIQNASRSTLTFYAGAFTDWDVDVDAFDDVGFTAMNGRLMGVTSAFESTIHVGTLLLGAPISGTSFWDFTAVPRPGTTSQQFQALSGGIQQPDIGPGDAHNIHGAGPITLKKGKKVTIWIGIIAGENRDQFLANAQAAAADVAHGKGQSDQLNFAWTAKPQRGGVTLKAKKQRLN